MVEDDVDDAFDVVVAGDGDDGDGEVEMPGCIDGDQSVDGALEEHARIFVDEVGTMTMAGDKVEVAFLQEIVLYTAHDGSGISVADFGDNDANGKAALRAQGTGEEVRTVLEFSRRGENAIFRVLGDGVGDRGAVDDQGDGCGRQSKVLGELFEAHRLANYAAGSIAGGLRLP